MTWLAMAGALAAAVGLGMSLWSRAHWRSEARRLRLKYEQAVNDVVRIESTRHIHRSQRANEVVVSEEMKMAVLSVIERAQMNVTVDVVENEWVGTIEVRARLDVMERS